MNLLNAMETAKRANVLENEDHQKASLATAGAVRIQDNGNPYDSVWEELAPTGAEVLTPDSPGYGESIKRWSDTCEKKAVRLYFLWTSVIRSYDLRSFPRRQP